jgi:hypothetical protein
MLTAARHATGALKDEIARFTDDPRALLNELNSALPHLYLMAD